MEYRSKSAAAILRVRNWYAKFERPISSLSLVGGFLFDALTLTRVDRLTENLWVVGHLAIIGTCMILVNHLENGGGYEANPEKVHFWLVNVIQFFFGGILSTFIVFYFRSGTIFVTWPFILLLAGAFIANESFKRQYARLAFQIALYFLSVLCFAIYLMPLFFHAVDRGVFFISDLASLAFLWLFLAVMRIAARNTLRRGARTLFFSVAAIFIGINFLYFYNIIPPLPLSLKDAGIYHNLIVNAPGNYTVQYEEQKWTRFFDLYEPVRVVEGEPLYAYSAVFSPASFNLNIIHEWQYYDDSAHAWVTRGRIPLSVSGGNDGGYKTFSAEAPFAPGLWRVNVETADGAIIGRLNFNVSFANSEPQLATKVIQ